MTWEPTLFDDPVARSTVAISVGKRSAWITYGPGMHRILRELDIPSMWCPREHCLTVPINRLGDLLALVEHRDRRAVELTAVDR